jgi:Putative DNA-binding domain
MSNVLPDPSENLPAFAERFASALIDPTRPTPVGVTGPRGKGAVKRYNVYRNNVTVSLIDALAAIYPAVQRITGTDFFRAMARFHVRATPPTSPLLFEYGRDFPAFIQSYEYAQDLPWLADVARIERAWLDAYHAADLPPLPPGALAEVPADRVGELILTAHPATRVVRSDYPAVAIFAMNRADGHVASLRSSAAEDALVTRPGFEVEVRLLPTGNATFLGRLIDGDTLAVAADAAFAETSSFDLPASLAGMIEAGVFTALRIGG